MGRFSKYIISALIFFVGVGVGAAGAQEEEVPLPTPQIVEVPGPTQRVEVEVVREVEVPGPTQTIEVEVEVVPRACEDALYAADRVIGDNAEWMLDVLSAYTDYPDEDLVDFGRRFEAIVAEGRTDEQNALWDEYVALADDCLAR